MQSKYSKLRFIHKEYNKPKKKEEVISTNYKLNNFLKEQKDVTRLHYRVDQKEFKEQISKIDLTKKLPF